MYRIFPPAPPLVPYIENYWAVDGTVDPVDLRVDVFVDGRPDLIFNHGAPYTREVIGGAAVEHHGSNLDAQRLVPIRITQRGEVRVIGARFRLGGLGAFVGVPLAPFTGRTPAPEELWGSDVTELDARLARQDAEPAVATLDAFFQERLRTDDGRSDFETALAAMSTSHGAVEVQDLAARVAASGRQVERLFARHLGIAPKSVARILRFQKALRALMRDPGVPLADVAADAGYYDHAHFIRDFRRLSGGVPRGYRGYYPPTSPTDFAPNVVAFVQDAARRA